MMLETFVNVPPHLLFLSGLHALIGVFVLVGVGVSIHDMHVVNTVLPLCLEVSYE